MRLDNVILAMLLVVLLIIIFNLYKINKSITKQNEELEDKYDKVVSQKKSSEVRLGKIGENMAPFFLSWPYDPNRFRFLGDPVDGIQFEDDGVVFVEIKTGKARLTQSQKTVKQLVKEGKVKFATFRIDEGGCSLKMEEECVLNLVQ